MQERNQNQCSTAKNDVKQRARRIKRRACFLWYGNAGSLLCYVSDSNTGLLLFGDVGTGKSFLTGVFTEERAAFIASLDDYSSLLVIDDLAMERNTEYAMEQMFTVIDSRYRSKKPLIVTTNLKLEEIRNPPDLAHARIYGCILERCAPVLSSCKNFREEGARATKAAAKEIVRKDNKSLIV